MRRLLPLLLPLSLGLVLAATSCETSEPTCDSRNCGGCCTEEGRCEVGNSPRACGLVGVACISCATSELCVEGSCVPASSDAGTGNAPTDAGSDPGTGSGTDAGTGSDTDAGTGSGQACTPGAPQPAECNYGFFCGPQQTCEPVPTPTCANFSNHPVTWNPENSSGPVIHAVELVSITNDPPYCPEDANRVRVRIRAYSPLGNLPTSNAGLTLRYVSGNGSVFTDTSIYNNIVTSEDRKNIQLEANLCIAAQVTTFSLGFYFEGGNGACLVVTR